MEKRFLLRERLFYQRLSVSVCKEAEWVLILQLDYSLQLKPSLRVHMIGIYGDQSSQYILVSSILACQIKASFICLKHLFD